MAYPFRSRNSQLLNVFALSLLSLLAVICSASSLRSAYLSLAPNWFEVLIYELRELIGMAQALTLGFLALFLLLSALRMKAVDRAISECHDPFKYLHQVWWLVALFIALCIAQRAVIYHESRYIYLF